MHHYIGGNLLKKQAGYEPFAISTEAQMSRDQ